MIEKLFIENFKCFAKANFELSNFNLLTGVNCGGKSTFIQALLILIQNVTQKATSPLNGHLVSIGDFSEARNFILNAREFTIGVKTNENIVEYCFEENSDKEIKANLTNEAEYFFDLLDYRNSKIHYLSAQRIGAQDIYNENLDKYDRYGIYGEYAIDYFDKNKSNTLNVGLVIDEVSYTLESQVNYWLKKIVNSELMTDNILGTYRVKAQYNVGCTQRWMRPSNIGSGISYIVSIIITCLSSNKGDIIIIENPEIHLHPKAQSILTDFFVLIANFGIQLIIESHSDHIFNGIRKNIFKKNIELNKVSIYYFDIINDLSDSKKINLDQNGQILNHIDGLFDQFDDDTISLLGL